MDPPKLDLQVAKYTAIAQLGEGGMARVYLALARGPWGFNKLVVLKILREEHTRDPSVAQMLYREAAIAAQLNHPNVVQTYEVIEHHGYPVMVMEYLEGTPLSSLRTAAERDGGRFPRALGLTALRDALRGLHYVHDACNYEGKALGLVHRDVSPQNLFLTYDGVVKVLDFGIAKATRASIHTESNAIRGKVRYMPPEQILGEPLDRRADIFAAGVILWEEITGRKIWEGKSDGFVLTRVVESGLPTPESVGITVPGGLLEIVLRATARDPGDRYATAEEFAAALDDQLRQGGSPPTSQELGAYASQKFSRYRVVLRRRVEQALAAANNVTDKLEPTGPLSFAPHLTRIGGELRSAGGASTTHGHRLPFRSASFWGWVVGGAIVLAAIGLVILPRTSAPTLTPSPKKLSPSASVPQLLSPRKLEPEVSPPVLSERSLRTAAPAATPSAPPSASVAKRAPPPIGSPRASNPPAVAPEASRVPTPPVARPPELDPCANPFIVEADGLRRIRPECIH